MHIVGLEEYDDYVLVRGLPHRSTTTQAVYERCDASHHDPTQAPPGKATAFMWQLATYNLWGNPQNWIKRAKNGLINSSQYGSACTQSG